MANNRSSNHVEAGARGSERTPLLASVNGNDGQETQVSGSLDRKKDVSTGRQIAPDLLRGFLMAAMAIDHTAVSMGAYPHGTGVQGEKASQVIVEWSSDLAYSLRTLTHLCASGFTMLLGMGVAYFVQSRLKQGWQPTQFIKHFLLRAFAIIVVNTIVFTPLTIVLGSFVIINAILWALAIDYLIVGGLALIIAFVIEPWLRRLAQGKEGSFLGVHGVNASLLVAGVVTLWISIWTAPNLGECLLSPNAGWADPTPDCAVDGHFFYSLFFGQVQCRNLYIISAFPPIPWLPFALLGYLYGRILIRGYFTTAQATATFNATLGVTFAGLFVSTRLLQYGNLVTHCLDTPDQRRQTPDSNQFLASLKSFFYVSKYPPSPAFAFFTLSGCFLLLAFFSAASLISRVEKALKSRYNPLLVYGNQPLFFYGLHLLLLNLASGFVLNSSLAKPMPSWAMRGKGIGLGWTFLVIYLLTLAVMYVACWYYAKFKARSGRDSVWRFL